jgi:hypothetical protein
LNQEKFQGKLQPAKKYSKWGNIIFGCWLNLPGLDFIKQFTPYAWNFDCVYPFGQIYSNLAPCICNLCSTYCIFSQIWVCSMLYSVCPTLMKSTPFLLVIKLVQLDVCYSTLKKKGVWAGVVHELRGANRWGRGFVWGWIS